MVPLRRPCLTPNDCLASTFELQLQAACIDLPNNRPCLRGLFHIDLLCLMLGLPSNTASCSVTPRLAPRKMACCLVWRAPGQTDIVGMFALRSLNEHQPAASASLRRVPGTHDAASCKASSHSQVTLVSGLLLALGVMILPVSRLCIPIAATASQHTMILRQRCT